MKAFLLAAGYGKRMGELTRHLPKPLLPVAGVPMISYALFQLYRWKVDLAVINLHYRGRQIEKYLQRFPHFPLRFSWEEEILGTAGALRKAIGSLLSTNETVVLLNCDTLLWPQEDDRPKESLCPQGGYCLFLKAIRSGESYTSFSWREDKNLSGAVEQQRERPIEIEEDGAIEMRKKGKYYYIGYSLVDTAALRQLQLEERFELTPLWREAGALGQLKGRLFRGEAYDGGDASAYRSIYRQNLVPAKLITEWQKFLAPWSQSA